MRYILDDNDYIEDVSFGNDIECNNKTSTKYTGEIPNGYESLEDWSIGEDGKLDAWKIVDGNLVFDNARYSELEELYEKELIDNSPVYHKDLYEINEVVEDIQDISYSQYQQENATGKIIAIDDVKKVYPKLKLTNIEPYLFNKINLITTGKNMLANTAKTEEINGITFTQNNDRSITIDGTATDNIEYVISGSSNSTAPLLCLKKSYSYFLNSGSYTMKMYNYDGIDRTEVYSGAGGVISFTDSDKPVTQIILYIAKGTKATNKTIFPMLELGNTASEYEIYKSSRLDIDFTDFIDDALFPSDTLFPSDDLFPMGTVIDYILISSGTITISKDGKEETINSGNVGLFDGYDTIYAVQDANLDMDYCINKLAVDDLSFIQGKETNTGKFKILSDGSIEAKDGYFSGDVYLGDGGKVIGGDGLLTNLTFSSKSLEDNVGWYSTDGTNFQKHGAILHAYIPDGFVISEAKVTLMHIPVYGYLTNYNSSTGEAQNVYYWGYGRNLQLYKATNLDNLYYTRYGYTGEPDYFSLDAEAVFTDDSTWTSSPWTAEIANSSKHNTQTVISGDIKDYLSIGQDNLLMIYTSDGYVSNNAEAMQKTCCVVATLNVIGYSKFSQ